MSNYDPKTIESKWSDLWYKNNLYEAVDFDPKPKRYILAELPYPSGKALHAGHMMRFTVPDIYSRYLRMRGFNVMFPIGWDSFGLPAENYAIKTGVHPAKLISDTVLHYKESIKQMGYGVDWNRVIDTSDPNYYKWTQWIFLKFFEAGLAEYKEMPIWWCEQLKTVLSDEEVLTDKAGNKISERGEYPVVKKNIKQWVLKITKYADQLLDGLGEVDFPEAIKSAQRNWIGRKIGATISFTVEEEIIDVFTTRPDTLFGVTFLVLAPEHPAVLKLLDKVTNKDEVLKYIDVTKDQSDLQRALSRIKTGIKLKGVTAKNSVDESGNNIPIFIADYVLMNYGAGAVMGVPGHDRRDFEFATQFGIDILRVVIGPDGDTSEIRDVSQIQEEGGILINSKLLNGLDVETAKEKMLDYLKEKGLGNRTTTYSIRDWVFSRQRYWGEPIPVIHKQDGSIEAVCNTNDQEEVNETLPLLLPDVPDYTPTSDGSSPLSKNKEWVATTDKDGKPAERETNTMPNWAGSCWYYMRYIDPKNDSTFADPKKLKYWLPVDRYFGGAEHTTMHLLYSRFWHRFLYDQKLVPTQEPYAWRINGGLLLGADGKKMSKSSGNAIEPINLVEKFGADSLRMYIPFLGPYEDTFSWNESGIKATNRLLKNVYDFRIKSSTNVKTDTDTLKMFHRLIKNITSMIDNLKMNTAISEFMIFVNHIKGSDQIDRNLWMDFIKLLGPFAPFLTEELWYEINGYTEFKKENSVHKQKWPVFDPTLADVKITSIPVQINGKLRGQIEINEKDTEETIKQKINGLPNAKPYLTGKEIKKFIYLPGKIVNVVN